MTSKMKGWQVNSPISPDIVRWQAVISSPASYLLKQVRKVIILSLICLIIKTIIHNTHIIPQIFLNKLMIIILIYSGTYIVWLAVDQTGFQLLYPQIDYLLHLLLYCFQTSQWYLNSEVDCQMYYQNLLVYFQTSLCSDLEKLHHNLIVIFTLLFNFHVLNKENKSDAGQQHSFTSFNLKKGSITMSSNSNGARDGCNSDTITLMTMIMNHAMMTIMATTVMITRRPTVIMVIIMI